LPIEGTGIFRECGVCLDGVAGSPVDMAGERVTLFGRPGLLITGSATVVFRKWSHRARPLSEVRFEVAFVDTPATPRRDIAVIGLYSVLFESTITGEVSGVLAEHALVKVLESGIAVDVVGNDPSPSSLPRSPTVHPANRSSSRAALRR